MRICRHCGAKLNGNLPYCPLCDMETEKLDDSFEEDYPYIPNHFSRRQLIKIATFSVLSVIAVSLLVNHLVPTNTPWAFITVAALVYVWLNLLNITQSTHNPGSVILCQLVTVSGLTLLLDLKLGWYRWSVNFVIPGLIMAAALAISLFIWIRPVRYRSFTIYQFVIAVIGILALILWFSGLSEVEWTAEAAAMVSLLCFLTITVFSWKCTRNELRKRFHL